MAKSFGFSVELDAAPELLAAGVDTGTGFNLLRGGLEGLLSGLFRRSRARRMKCSFKKFGGQIIESELLLLLLDGDLVGGLLGDDLLAALVVLEAALFRESPAAASPGDLECSSPASDRRTDPRRRGYVGLGFGLDTGSRPLRVPSAGSDRALAMAWAACRRRTEGGVAGGQEDGPRSLTCFERGCANPAARSAAAWPRRQGGTSGAWLSPGADLQGTEPGQYFGFATAQAALFACPRS